MTRKEPGTMITEERMHELFADALPDDEPALPDFRPTARENGRRLRRRRGAVRGAVGLACAGAVLASGTFAVEYWPESGAATGSGAAATGPADTPQAMLLTALRANLPEGFTAIRSTDGATSYELTAADRGTVGLGVQEPVPYPYGSLPLSPCGDAVLIGLGSALDNPHGWPVVAGTDCERRTLPDGSQAVSGHQVYADGINTVWIMIVTPDGRETALVGSTNPETGRTDTAPPSDDQLFQLASVPEVIAAVRGLPDKSPVSYPPGTTCSFTIPPGGPGMPECVSPTPPPN